MFRYLPKGNYVLLEMEAPSGYDLPLGINAETKFEVSGTTIETDVEVINIQTGQTVIKYSLIIIGLVIIIIGFIFINKKLK